MKPKAILVMGFSVLGCATAVIVYRATGRGVPDVKHAEPAEGSLKNTFDVARRSSMDDEGRELQSEVRSLAAQLGVVQAELRNPIEPPPMVSDSGTEARSLTQEEEEEKRRSAWSDHMADVDAEFQSESRDPRWSSIQMAALRSALEELPDLRDAARSIECRSRLCRIEIIEDKAEVISAALPVLFRAVSSDLPKLEINRPAGKADTPSVIAYLTRGE